MISLKIKFFFSFCEQFLLLFVKMSINYSKSPLLKGGCIHDRLLLKACICGRPSSDIQCLFCGTIIKKGRVRKKCPLHSNVSKQDSFS